MIRLFERTAARHSNGTNIRFFLANGWTVSAAIREPTAALMAWSTYDDQPDWRTNTRVQKVLGESEAFAEEIAAFITEISQKEKVL